MENPVYEKTYTVSYFFRHPHLYRSLFAEAWRDADGLRGRAFGLPAVVAYDAASYKPVLKMWYSEGYRHNHNAPAYQKIDPDTGVVVSEAWYRTGRLSRHDGGPARIRRSPGTGNVVEEKYIESGQKHRLEGPAVVKYDPFSGEVIEEEYWVRGKKLPNATGHLKPLFPSP